MDFALEVSELFSSMHDRSCGRIGFLVPTKSGRGRRKKRDLLKKILDVSHRRRLTDGMKKAKGISGLEIRWTRCRWLG